LINGEKAGFISPTGFLSMHLFQGTGWILLTLVAARGEVMGSPLSFATIHAFGLGFMSLAALSVLVHVLPAAARIPVGERIGDRWPVAGVIIGTVFFVGGWILANLSISLIGGSIIFLSVLYFLSRVVKEMIQARERKDLQTKALGIMVGGALVFFLFGISLGTYMLYSFVHPVQSRNYSTVPVVHAVSMIGGWLSLLVMAVFLRTSGPLLGRSILFPRGMISWALISCGILSGLTGLLLHLPISIDIGFIVGISGILLYVLSIMKILLRSHPVNPVPRWFLFSSCVSLLLGTGLLLSFERYRQVSLLSLLLIFLLGWLGQFLLAHLYHLGPRLLLILKNGPGDLTPPIALLDPKRSRTTFMLYQVGIGSSCISFWFQDNVPNEVRVGSAVIGFLAWLSLSREIQVVWKKAKIIPPTRDFLFNPVVKINSSGRKKRRW